jgi:Leucine-rich repeat (LRR) protein
MIAALLMTSSPMIFAATIPVTAELSQQNVTLGQGYDSRNGVFLQPCWTGSIAYAGSQVSHIQLDASLSREDVLKDVTASFEGGVDLLLVSGSVKTTVQSKFQERRYRETLTYSASYRGKTAILKNPVLSQNLAELKKSDPLRFRALCGDSFAKEALFGGQLYIFVHFDFLNQEQKDLFKTKVKVRALGFSKTKTITKDTGWSDRSARITIDAVQIGGNPQYLSDVLSSQRRECHLADTSGCEKVIDSLLAYALSQNKKSFPWQMAASSFQSGNSEQPPALTAIRTDSSTLQEVSNIDRVLLSQRLGTLEADEAYLRQKMTLYPSDSQRFLFWRNFLRSNVLPLKDRVIRISYLCRVSSPCNLENLMPSSDWEKYLMARQDLEPDYGFVDACLVSSGDVDLEWATSVLLQSLGFKGRSTRACEEAAQKLRHAKSLHLGGLNLKRVEPLADAIDLESLDISFNNIEDIAALSRMSKLKWLNLRSNQITSLYAIRNLKLQHLNAGFNKLREVRALERNSYDTFLVHGNDFVSVQDVPVKAGVLIRSEDELCALQRQRLYDDGWLSQNMFNAYTQANFLPVVEGENVTIKPCSIASPVFDEIQAGIFPSRT